MSYMYEVVFGPENVAATIRGIHPDYGPQFAVIMQRLSLFNIFQDHSDFLTGYEGVSVSGLHNQLSFTLRFVNWKKGWPYAFCFQGNVTVRQFQCGLKTVPEAFADAIIWTLQNSTNRKDLISTGPCLPTGFQTG